MVLFCVFLFKQKTAYEMRISDWSSDVCSSDLLFKISFPAEFHAQTAVESAMDIHARLKAAGKSAGDIRQITIRTHEACIRIIDKKGPLDNPAEIGRASCRERVCQYV